ncbi:UBP-type zinc finger domain-containing protein [Chitinophaga sp. sic0106]|uniref:UBP-type zinc finger domain-containing protein n=1 Tax=Chitinophaga sp. sic0106 TaxID=2854785 RepID=UPI001C4792D0|nr:UBP-type zinc finger domain-containing protein [Chitinophaga sp. sic0106]MBV7530671.1 UBP-type zinc finger domain-containing protein [Chitinophaga sp. sic0106]
MAQDEICQHIRDIKELKTADKYECAECVKIGSDWVHLRTCQTCGVTLCCDQSPNKHMTAHFHATDHPVVISSEPGEQWLYCYKDDTFAEYG